VDKMGCGAWSGGAGGIQGVPRGPNLVGRVGHSDGQGLDDFAGDSGLELRRSGSVGSGWRSGSRVLVGCKGSDCC